MEDTAQKVSSLVSVFCLNKLNLNITLNEARNNEKQVLFHWLKITWKKNKTKISNVSDWLLEHARQPIRSGVILNLYYKTRWNMWYFMFLYILFTWLNTIEYAVFGQLPCLYQAMWTSELYKDWNDTSIRPAVWLGEAKLPAAGGSHVWQEHACVYNFIVKEDWGWPPCHPP